jgi:hypothetical protein
MFIMYVPVTTLTVKKVTDFPVPSRDVTYQTLLEGNNLIIPAARETSRLGTGKSLTLFYSVPPSPPPSDRSSISILLSVRQAEIIILIEV